MMDLLLGGQNKAFSKKALQKIVKSLNQYFLYIKKTQ